jgi:hypothetical protein
VVDAQGHDRHQDPARPHADIAEVGRPGKQRNAPAPESEGLGFPDDFHGQFVTKRATPTRIFKFTPAPSIGRKAAIRLSCLGMEKVILVDELEEQGAEARNFEYPRGFERRTVSTKVKAAPVARGLDYRGRGI